MDGARKVEEDGAWGGGRGDAVAECAGFVCVFEGSYVIGVGKNAEGPAKQKKTEPHTPDYRPQTCKEVWWSLRYDRQIQYQKPCLC